MLVLLGYLCVCFIADLFAELLLDGLSRCTWIRGAIVLTLIVAVAFLCDDFNAVDDHVALTLRVRPLQVDIQLWLTAFLTWNLLLLAR